MMSKDTIRQQLLAAASDVVAWFDTFGPERWDHAPPGKWTAGQHLEHLIRSVKPLNKALKAPKVALRLSFGKPNRLVRDLETIQAKYEKGLAGGFQAVGPFIPPDTNSADRAQMLADYQAHHRKLDRIISKWSESALDNYLVPHPALGKMMIREILFFTIIHTRHHLRILKEKYENV